MMVEKAIPPFSGCTMVVSFNVSEDDLFRRAVKTFMNCGHSHNFMVEMGATRVYCSELALTCLRNSGVLRSSLV